MQRRLGEHDTGAGPEHDAAGAAMSTADRVRLAVVPSQTYAGQWIEPRHFLTGEAAVVFHTFDEACRLVRGAVERKELAPTQAAYKKWQGVQQDLLQDNAQKGEQRAVFARDGVHLGI